MQLLSIGVSDKYEVITNKLQIKYTQIENSNISLYVKPTSISNTNYIICDINENSIHKKYLEENIRLATINVLTDYIIEKYEEKILSRIVNTNYCYFTSTEKKEILNIALINLEEYNSENILNNLYMIRRKNTILRSLMEYFESNEEINIEGFVTFRLQNYIKELESIIDKSVDDFLMEKEYQEFIKLLKYFVEVQEPKLKKIHIIAKANSGYVLLDEEYNEITNQCIRDFMEEVREGELNFDDLLVSSLITLAPKKIVVHGHENMKNKELFDTIKNVFIGKVETCDNCDICTSKKYNNIDNHIH